MKTASRYTLLFRNEAYVHTELDEAEQARLFGAFIAWIDDLSEQGICDSSDALHPAHDAATVRRRGETLTIDGPYAETHEAINGFVTVTVPDLAAALAVARTCPGLGYGMAVEVRQIMDVAKPD